MTVPTLPNGPRAPRWAQMLAYGLMPYRFFEGARRRYGDVFTVRLMGSTWVVLAAPDAVQAVFNAPPEALDAGVANWPLRPFIGTSNLFFLDGRAHLTRRKLVLPPFHGEAMRSQQTKIRAIARSEIVHWPREVPTSALPRLRRISFEVMLAAVFGTDSSGTQELRASLWDLVTWAVAKRNAGVYALLGAERFMALPGYRRSVHRVDERLFALIESRRGANDNADRDDLLAQLLLARSEDGAPLTSADIRDELMAILLAGHETTTGLLAWAVHELARHPDTQQWMLEGGPDAVEAVVTETLRLHPPASIAAIRRLRAPLEVGDLRLPAGITVALTPLLLHRRHEAYTRPLTFDPTRFADRRRPPGGYWLPFGGGVRRCIGSAFARFQAREVLTEIVTCARLAPSPTRRAERLDRHGFVAVPAKGARVILRPRNTPA